VLAPRKNETLDVVTSKIREIWRPGPNLRDIGKGLFKTYKPGMSVGGGGRDELNF